MIHHLHPAAFNKQNAGRLLLGVTALAVACFFYSIVSNDAVVGLLSDDAVYLLMAEIYSPWHTTSSPAHEFIRWSNRFPPLYPVLLGMLGAHTGNPPLAAYITVGFLVTALLIVGIWLQRERRCFSLAFVLPLVVAFLPSTLLLSQELWSEFLFMCFFYGAFAVLAAEEKTREHWLLVALLIGLSCLTRSIGITVIAAFALYLWLQRPRPSFGYVLISSLPFLYWQAHELFMRDNIDNYWADLRIYFNSATHTVSGVVIDDWSGFVMNQVVVMWQAWRWLFSVLDTALLPNTMQTAVLILLLLLALTGFCVRIRHRKLDAFCLIFYLLAIVIWPHPGLHFMSRFLYPLLPLFIFYIWLGLTKMAPQPRAARFSAALFILLIAVIAYPATKQFIGRAYANADVGLQPYRRSRDWLLAPSFEAALKHAKQNRGLLNILTQLQEHIPENECIYAIQTPIVMLYSRRITGMLPHPPTTRDALLTATRSCRFMLAMNAESLSHHFAPFYPLEHLQNNDGYAITPFYSDSTADEAPLLYLIERTTR